VEDSVSTALVLFGSTDGHTAKIAGVIADILRAEGCSADVLDARDAAFTSPDRYDAVVIAASLHAGGYQPAVSRWTRAHAAMLSVRPSAFVSVCLGVLEHREETDRDLDRRLRSFFSDTRWAPSRWTIVAGALPWTRYGWLKKRAMRRIVRKTTGDIDFTRDFEYTDWNAVRAFAKDFAETNGLTEPRMALQPA
jgi:menaquinone-dependent protoporphyrinogen oxidase